MKPAVVRMPVLLLSFAVACILSAAEDPLWEQLMKKEGCLVSAADVNFTTEGSVFGKSDWQAFFRAAEKDEKLFLFLVGKFGSRRPTGIHICNFRNATEGEAAVFAAQQIVKKNWYAYDGDDPGIKRTARKNAVSKALLLKDVLSDELLCAALRSYFVRQYRKKYSDLESPRFLAAVSLLDDLFRGGSGSWQNSRLLNEIASDRKGWADACLQAGRKDSPYVRLFFLRCAGQLHAVHLESRKLLEKDPDDFGLLLHSGLLAFHYAENGKNFERALLAHPECTLNGLFWFLRKLPASAEEKGFWLQAVAGLFFKHEIVIDPRKVDSAAYSAVRRVVMSRKGISPAVLLEVSQRLLNRKKCGYEDIIKRLADPRVKMYGLDHDVRFTGSLKKAAADHVSKNRSPEGRLSGVQMCVLMWSWFLSGRRAEAAAAARQVSGYASDLLLAQKRLGQGDWRTRLAKAFEAAPEHTLNVSLWVFFVLPHSEEDHASALEALWDLTEKNACRLNFDVLTADSAMLLRKHIISRYGKNPPPNVKKLEDLFRKKLSVSARATLGL